MGLTYAAIRFRRESRSSQKRLEELEKSSEAQSSLGAMLRRMEMAVADAMDPADPGVSTSRRRSQDSILEEGGAGLQEEDNVEMKKRKATRPDTPEMNVGSTSLPTPLLTPIPTSTSIDPLHTTTSTSTLPIIPESAKKDPLQPVLTPSQLQMIASLNSIPQLKKVRAYFPYVMNSHSVIIVRDPKQFAAHSDGLGVLSHWADRWVL